jgi:hypothetical protein
MACVNCWLWEWTSPIEIPLIPPLITNMLLIVAKLANAGLVCDQRYRTHPDAGIPMQE